MAKIKSLKQMEALKDALDGEIAEREERFDSRSERWQESEAGEEFLEKTDRLQEMLDEVDGWIDELTD